MPAGNLILLPKVELHVKATKPIRLVTSPVADYGGSMPTLISFRRGPGGVFTEIPPHPICNFQP